jgi:hypothetical protein
MRHQLQQQRCKDPHAHAHLINVEVGLYVALYPASFTNPRNFAEERRPMEESYASRYAGLLLIGSDQHAPFGFVAFGDVMCQTFQFL